MNNCNSSTIAAMNTFARKFSSRQPACKSPLHTCLSRMDGKFKRLHPSSPVQMTFRCRQRTPIEAIKPDMNVDGSHIWISSVLQPPQHWSTDNYRSIIANTRVAIYKSSVRKSINIDQSGAADRFADIKTRAKQKHRSVLIFNTHLYMAHTPSNIMRMFVHGEEIQY